MNYTDKELIRASQIAYLTINREVIKEAFDTVERINENNPDLKIELNYTLSELFEYSDTFRRSIYESICNITKCDYEEVLTRDKAMMYAPDEKSKQIISEKFDIIDDILHGEIGSWKVVSYVDNNTIGTAGTAGKLVDGEWVHDKFSSSGDGLAAVVFDTGGGQAITAFRGSEDFKNLNDLVADWLAADGGLALSDRDTPQQKSVEKFVKEYLFNMNYNARRLPSVQKQPKHLQGMPFKLQVYRKQKLRQNR